MNLASNSQDQTSQQIGPSRTHDLPTQGAISEFMKTGWAADVEEIISAHPVTAYTKLRRDKLSKKYLGKRLIFPAGSLKVRSNDADYPFRAHSALLGLLELLPAILCRTQFLLWSRQEMVMSHIYLFTQDLIGKVMNFIKTQDTVSFGLERDYLLLKLRVSIK